MKILWRGTPRLSVGGDYEVDEMTVFDGHSDLLYDVMKRREAGETCVLERHHLDRLRQGGVEGLVLALWTGGEGVSLSQSRTRRMVACAKAELAECPAVQIIHAGTEAEKVREQGKLYAFWGVEGMEALNGDPAGLDQYADLGARLGMLTWNEENALATGAKGDPDKGLTEAGKAVIRRMEDRNMLVDVSHLNDGGFWDVMRLTHGPVIASHSNCRALCNVSRNLTDEQLRMIRDTGGVVGLNVFHGFVHEELSKKTVETLAIHAAHMADVMGIEHVACGFDFCEFIDPDDGTLQGLEDASKIGNFMEELKKLGMNDQERQMVARDNFLRVLG